MAYTTPRTWTTGQTVTAAEMNQDVRDNVAEVYSRVNTKNMIITAVFEDELLVANNTTPVKTITIPAALNGALLTDADAAVHTAAGSGGGLVEVRIYNLTDSQNMLSTNITIDAEERNSYTAATAPVINTAYDDVATGDRIAIYVKAIGTGARGLDVMLTFAVQS